jgi:hypothetical protein
MKTLLLARPDHSIRLYENLRQYPDLDIKFHTFSAFKKDSWLSQWKSYVNTVDSEADISYAFTIFHRLLYFLHQHFFFEFRSISTIKFFKNIPIQRLTLFTIGLFIVINLFENFNK